MKRRIALVFSIFAIGLFSTVLLRSQSGPCANCSGDPWTDDWGGSWYLDTSGSTVTGRVRSVPQNPGCPIINYATVTGSFNTNNSTLDITATNPDQSSTSTCLVATWVRYTGLISPGGCDTGNGSWSNSLSFSGSWEWSKNCDIPPGYMGSPTESTYSAGWRTDEPTLHNFLGLVNADRDFGGRSVQESDYAPASDGCYFTNSEFDPMTGLTGGTWGVGLMGYNTYGYDTLGPRVMAVDYYRPERLSRGLPMPCRVTLYQAMSIRCNSSNSWAIYKNNVMYFDIDVTTVAASRDGVYSIRNY